MKIKKCLYLFIAALSMLNIAVPICGASERISPDMIKFQGMGWEIDANGSNVFMGTLQNVAGKDIEFIGLRCAFYDIKGVEINHGVVNVLDVGKDGFAKFKFYPSAPLGTVTATIIEVDVYAKEVASPIQAAAK